MGSICGVTIVKSAIKYDYCIKECILSLLECCDYVVCVFVASLQDDGTLELIKSIDNPLLRIVELPESDWNFIQGKERLSYITNIGIELADKLGFEYVLYVQSDEIIDNKSKLAIRQAVNEGGEGYLCKRINLWGSPYTELNIPISRMPCSTEVIRLTKANYRAVDDAESIAAPASFKYVNDIVIWHMGFVRKRSVMKSKIINMQEGVFAMANHDTKLDQEEEFNPTLWFNESDLKPISTPLPGVIRQWAADRSGDYLK